MKTNLTLKNLIEYWEEWSQRTKLSSVKAVTKRSFASPPLVFSIFSVLKLGHLTENIEPAGAFDKQAQFQMFQFVSKIETVKEKYH